MSRYLHMFCAIAAFWALSFSSAMAATFNYSSSGITPIPDGTGANACGAIVSRTISVPDSFIIGDLNVGLVVDHTYKEDLVFAITSPANTQVIIINRQGGNEQNYNVRLDTDETTPLATVFHDDTAIYPEFIRQSFGNLDAFNGENASGTWTLLFQDCFNADTGNLQDFFLEFTDTVADPLVVTSTADTNTIGTLRFAINHANSTPADDAITFNISGAGPHVIAPSSALPIITDDNVSLDGTTQSGVVCNGTPNATGGMSTRQHQIAVLGTNQTAGDLLGISGANNVTIQGLTIGLGVDDGLDADNADGLTLLCNHFGASTATTTDIGNADNGVEISNSDNVSIGDGTLAGLNVFGFNVAAGLNISNSNTGIIARNFFGVGADGLSDIGNGGDGLTLSGGASYVIGGLGANDGNVFSGNADDGIDILGASNVSLLANYVGTDAIGATAVPNLDEGVVVRNTGASANIGNGSALGQNIIAGNISTNVYVLSNGSATIDNNLIGVGSSGQALGGPVGVDVFDGVSTTVRNNIIRNHNDQGVLLRGTTQAAVYANEIFNNGDLGIDLEAGSDPANNVTDNDMGDADSGANNLLNFPVINIFGANGTTSVSYDFNLDVPSAANGYRVEFFSNSAADSSGHGEGETFLGFVDVAHAGGNLNFSGSFTANQAVAIAEIISATATRKTGASSYDITSEFAANQTSSAAISPLVVTNTNDTGAGSLRAALTFANSNTAEDAISFNIPGAGPHVISPMSALPTLTDPGISLDGTTQASASCGQLATGTQHDLRIQIDGTNAGTLVQGIEVTASDVTLRGLSMTNFDSFGVGVRVGGDNFTGECLHIGVAPDGTTKGPNAKSNNRTPGIRFISVANATVRNSLISGNDDDALDRGLRFESVTGGLIEGNIVGLNAAGSAPLGNSSDGIFLDVTTSNITIGGVTPATRNILSGNGRHGIFIDETGSNFTILGNYIGLGLDGSADIGNGGNGININDSTNINIGDGTAAGRNVISNNDGFGISSSSSDDVTIRGNYIGTDANGNIAAANALSGALFTDSERAIIGGDTAGHGNLISGNLQSGVLVSTGVVDALIVGNTIGTNAADTAPIGNGHSGVWVWNGASAVVRNNIIRNSGYSGVTVAENNTRVAIYTNSISSNLNLGIDLDSDFSVTANDSGGGDADTGPNDLLNFPVINDILVDGTTSVDYDFTLDVPTNTPGYRVEFFRNSAADLNGHGEGEVYLGAIDVSGTGTHTGSFAAAVTVDIGDIISTTTTRKTGVLTYDITSEFSANETAISSNPASLAVTKTVSNLLSSDYAIPGSDMIYTFSVVNEGGGSVSSDSIVLIDAMPEQIHFFNGDYDGPGPSTAVIGFEETGTSLTFNPAVDALYSDAVTKPSNLSECNYTPTSGYDSNVNYICFNPKGEMLGGDPDPSFLIKFRARIQ